MTCIEFRDAIGGELKRARTGRTWKELREGLQLPYKQPCPEWVKSLESDIGLSRCEKRGNAYIWKLER